jgi:hypothetical protein
MTDVEKLLRETLVDPRRRLEPAPGIFETVRERARQRRRRLSGIALATCVVVALAITGTVFGVNAGDEHRRSTPATGGPSPTGTPIQGSLGDAINLGSDAGSVVAAAVNSNSLYVLTDKPGLVKVDPVSGRVLVVAAGPAGTAAGVTADAERVWAWSQDTTNARADIRAYDANSLAYLGAFTAPGDVFNAVAVGDGLYFTTGGSLMQVTTQRNAVGDAEVIQGMEPTGMTFGITDDPGRHRLLVGVTAANSLPVTSAAGARVVAVDSATGKLGAMSPATGLGKESIAVVGGQVWIAGFGDIGQPRVVHLDAATLQPAGTTPLNNEVGPGAIVWAGSKVLWVRDGGSEGLSCVDSQSGAILEQWPEAQGPVASIRGVAYVANNGFLQPLTLVGDCTG